MSKAFTREDAADAPLVPPRPPLPPGVTNYVTPRGLGLLRDELRRLQAERAAPEVDGPAEGDGKRSSAHAALAGRINELEGRLATATLVDPADLAHDEARFGATVTVRNEAGDERRYQIVGIDEADVAAGRVAFVAPLARALLGKRAGDAAVVRTPRGNEELEVLAVRYDGDVEPPSRRAAAGEASSSQGEPAASKASPSAGKTAASKASPSAGKTAASKASPSRSKPAAGDALPTRSKSAAAGKALPSRSKSAAAGKALPSRSKSAAAGKALPSRSEPAAAKKRSGRA